MFIIQGGRLLSFVSFPVNIICKIPKMQQIRKFGLEYCDLPTMLWNVSVMLRILTLNIDKRNTKRISIPYYIFTAVVITSYIYVYNISVVWYSFFYCRVTPTCYRLSSIIVFSLGVASSIGVCKLFFMYLYEDKIRNIAAECLLCDMKTILGSRFETNILKTMRFIKKRAMIFWIVIISNGVVYFLKPLLIPGRHFPEDDLIVLGLDPVFESPNYEIAFALTTAGIFVTVYLPSNITGFLIIVTGYIEAQILALSEEIIQLWIDAENNYNNTVPVHNEELTHQEENKEKAINEFINNRLKDIVKIHIININLFHQVEAVFRGAIAIEFTLLMISLTAVLLGGLENTYMQIPFGLMQVAVDCFTGQRVIDACVTFEKAIYSCQWENFDGKNMKIVLLLLQNSMKTLKLSAGGLSTLSFPCFMSVLKSIYSAFTTLHSTL